MPSTCSTSSTTPPTTVPEPTGERLQKVLARVGLGSRRTCDELIEAGRITVNGEVAQLGRRVDIEVDLVEVDGVPVGVRPGLVHYLLNKPRGVVTTASDTHGRPIVVELVPAEPRVFPVGRLDTDTEGLLILTNDGDLAHRLTHPSFGVDKEYLASVDGQPSRGTLRRLREGIELDDGPAKVDDFAMVDSLPGRSLVRITLHEGRKRIVRRLLDAVGFPVEALVRTDIGEVALGEQRPGSLRALTRKEVGSLYKAVGL